MKSKYAKKYAKNMQKICNVRRDGILHIQAKYAPGTLLMFTFRSHSATVTVQPRPGVARTSTESRLPARADSVSDPGPVTRNASSNSESESRVPGRLLSESRVGLPANPPATVTVPVSHGS